MRYFIRFAYDGTNFHGSQSQPNGVTVQETMEQALALIFRESVPLTFAGRTDAGVHAREMYAHFDLPLGVDTSIIHNLAFRLNGILPDTIAIYDILPVIDEAHARFSATRRTYEYHVIDHKDPFLLPYATRLRTPLNYAAMNEAALYLIGRQDFASFCRTHTDVKTTICNLTQAQWREVGDGHAIFTIAADRFLRNMVRAVVGTLFLVGQGKMNKEQFAQVINQHQRSAAGDSAPAQGLYLTRIDYPKELFLQK
ncbi:MAG: tRNA pseudouridine(38-40) synthase TruA [Paludibacteraceae bacterium]|nr:tRNA pseudouridine(38-40) synthase TruA [Paludibacteraceae bacterium]